MSYYESAKGITITRKRAVKEVLNHYGDLKEFYADMGIHKTYSAKAVLAWLGY
tara:strand:+ start:195 stop:353 length:159 start_codon:yes stop_codon:yes gene_type:complete